MPLHPPGVAVSTTALTLRRLPGAGQVVRALGVGGVPATGFFAAGWSIGTLLVLYWLETILVTVVVSVVILGHRRATRSANRRHDPSRGQRSSNGSHGASTLRDFLSVMVPFTAGHGVFVAAFAFLVFPQEVGPEAGVSFVALRDGLLGITIFILAGLVLDLVRIGRRPFQWVERMRYRAQGRMIVTHLTIIFGAAAMSAFDTPAAFLAVFVALKSLLDLGGMLPDREA